MPAREITIINKLGLHARAAAKFVGVAGRFPCQVRVGRAPDKLVDGCFGETDDWYTKWFPNGFEPQWATIDLGQLHAITKTIWIPAKEDIDAKKAYRYRIDISDDNKAWRSYADRSAADNVGAEYVDERAERARYVRLTLTPRKGGTENLDRPKVAEVMVFGKPIGKR